MKEKKSKISITVDPPVLEKVTLLAEHECRPLSQYINLILKFWTEDDELRNIYLERQHRL